jgi:alkanesulfonate monooxygenase SsuD/methylene tetrahydromethanopterin reductase-like flavin-dependent oxidoreductase (luciferase family)
MLWASAVGAPGSVLRRLNEILAITRADELIVAGAVHDHVVRLASYERLAELRPRLGSAPPA